MIFVAKGLFSWKRACPDLHPTIEALYMHVKGTNEDEWKKVLRFLRCINGPWNENLIFSMDKLHVNKWYVDAAFSVISYFKHHNGGIKNYGNKFPILKWRKQKLNTRSSTNSELVGTDKMSTMIFRKIFMEVQGYRIKNM